MTTCKIHFVNGKVLEIEGCEDKILNNYGELGLVYEYVGNNGINYSVNMDKVLYIEFVEAE